MDIEKIAAQIGPEISGAGTLAELEELRIKYLGRKGVVSELTGSISRLPKEEKASFGQKVNALKNSIQNQLEEKASSLSGSGNRQSQIKPVQVDLPGICSEPGSLHPLTQVMREICSIFVQMGFSIVEGPDIETEFNNFTGLNIPLEHPSRDAFDTFYLKGYEKLLLRSHTSPVQIRAMKAGKPPLAAVVPGRVYRPDAVDASHSFMFHQIEGFMVDSGIKFSDLKGVLETFAKAVFGQDIKMRFRPHFFPFTEPSAEVDVSCFKCKGKGCSVCGRKGWLEILGSGMIHPNVFKHVGIDHKKYSGFAFGMGVERIAMLKFGIEDIRMFFENDIRFLRQF